MSEKDKKVPREDENNKDEPEYEGGMYGMYGPPCPPGEHEMQFAEVNSYGTMFKCAKCGMTDFAD